MRRLGQLLAGVALASGLLSGCATMAPQSVPGALPVPQAWPTGGAYLRQDQAGLPAYSWRDVFGDPRLQAVIARALTNNQDTRLAAANVAAARATYRIQRAAQLPELDAGSSVTHNDGARLGTPGASSGSSASGSGGGGATNSLAAETGVSGYELDLFGRLRSLTGAAQDRYFSSVSAERASKLAVVSEVADAWVAYAKDTTLLTVARQTAASAGESYRIAGRRLTGGIAPRSDVRQAEIVLRIAESDIANQTTLLAQDANALRLLAGAEVAPGELPTSVVDAGAQLAEVPAGLDSTTLLRRPDVMEAEFNLRAADAQIGAARAALFPKITLTGLLGLASSTLGALFTGGAFAWSAGAAASYPIFRGGGARQNVRLTEAQRDAALASYRKTIEVAFQDVADTLARRGTIDAQLAALTAGRAAAADNLQLADLRYRGGIDTYLAELTARQSLYSAEKALAAARAVKATNLVALYRSLGGERFEEAAAQ